MTPAALRIALRAKWSWYTFVVEPLLGLFIFVVTFTSGLLSSKTAVFITISVTLVTVLRRWLWNIDGTEELTSTMDRLTVRYGICGVGWPIHYRLKDVSNYRYVPPVHAYRSHENRTLGFDYEFLPRRFGLYLSESDVNQLIEVIQSRLTDAPSTLCSSHKVSAESAV